MSFRLTRFWCKQSVLYDNYGTAKQNYAKKKENIFKFSKQYILLAFGWRNVLPIVDEDSRRYPSHIWPNCALYSHTNLVILFYLLFCSIYLHFDVVFLCDLWYCHRMINSDIITLKLRISCFKTYLCYSVMV